MHLHTTSCPLLKLCRWETLCLPGMTTWPTLVVSQAPLDISSLCTAVGTSGQSLLLYPHIPHPHSHIQMPYTHTHLHSHIHIPTSTCPTPTLTYTPTSTFPHAHSHIHIPTPTLPHPHALHPHSHLHSHIYIPTPALSHPHSHTRTLTSTCPSPTLPQLHFHTITTSLSSQRHSLCFDHLLQSCLLSTSLVYSFEQGPDARRARKHYFSSIR